MVNTEKVITDYVSIHRNNKTPIYIVPKSKLAPELFGQSYYFTTPSGKTIVKYPLYCKYCKEMGIEPESFEVLYEID